ncbi:hypothetical protein F400_gp066 [Bacillus phage BCD7]|uniref:Uncharacterized protein n=1 Tax=Bacillus phage BCD7 TaxID=1136534 RepID=J9PTY8_9CAUD|nr:hypothetical protein F400_gp066 [Bacillus phage BCD7]AEZ50513.1 hypothetical protein BCD7_0066 [Bacillus phage BCD7]
MKIKEAKRLLATYGNITLEDLVAYVQGLRQYECPKCKGEGETYTTYNKYPTGLPDSGWVYQEGRDYKPCDICSGYGYTEREIKPVTQTTIVGYE